MKIKINNRIEIKKSGNKHYLTLRDKKGQVISINGHFARLELQKQGKLYSTLGLEGYYQFAPSKKEFRIFNTRFAGENEIYKIKKWKEVLFGGKFEDFWEVEGLTIAHLNLLLDTIYWGLREKVKIEIGKEKNGERLTELKSELADFYSWELKAEGSNSSCLYRTNPFHVADLKKYIKELRA